jgi:predicted nucleic acid-binding Zn ribbon protein
MVRIIKCDVCGKEIPSGGVFARVTYKVDVETTTKTGKVKIKRITRTADLCSSECFERFTSMVESSH